MKDDNHPLVKDESKIVPAFTVGICILILAWLIVLNKQYPIWGNNFFLLGIYTVFDDIIEHTVTANTPLRFLTEKILEPTLKKVKYFLKNHFEASLQ